MQEEHRTHGEIKAPMSGEHPAEMKHEILMASNDPLKGNRQAWREPSEHQGSEPKS